jgi:hypothetical protein
MSLDLKLSLWRTRIRHCGAKAGMRASSVVVRGPGFEGLSDVPLVERNHRVQTLSACTADQAFAECVAWGDLYGVFSTVRPNDFSG